jgi:nicotinamide phosphoribosyltransferase
MAAFSVPATEHSVQCSYGPLRQEEYIERVLSKYLKPQSIVSIVMDGYDIYRDTQLLCDKFGEFVMSMGKQGARLVIRPDSGDPLEVIPRIIDILEKTFGCFTNKKGYKVLNYVGVLQGDGIDQDAIREILSLVTSLGYSATNLVFGSGGALLQKVNRDTYKFAQKVCAMKVNGAWVDIFKDPITDPGKKSKAGFINTFRNKQTGEYATLKCNTMYQADIDPEGLIWENAMQVIYSYGEIFNFITLDEVRANTGMF